MTFKPTPRPIPFGPLESLIDAAGRKVLADKHGDRQVRRLRAAYFRAKRRGCMDVFTADSLAMHLCGEHPALIWPKEWRDAS